MRKNLRDECYKETESRCEEMYVGWLEERVFALETAVEKLTDAQHTQPAKCLGCFYWQHPSAGHCIRGSGDNFCIKSGIQQAGA